MLFLALNLSFLILVLSARIYEIELSVDDDASWEVTNNASVYFVLTTNINGNIYESPAYIIQDGLPSQRVYKYTLLSDDIGEATALRLLHSDANTLCIDWISVDGKNVTDQHRTYDCRADQFYKCQQITAYLDAKEIVHEPEGVGCDWNTIRGLHISKKYNVEIVLTKRYKLDFYNKIGLLFEGFVFDSYSTPYYNLSYSFGAIYQFEEYDKIVLSVVSYDVTPLQSLLITTRNTEKLCIKSTKISITNDAVMNVEKEFIDPQCIQYNATILGDNGCSVLSIDFRKNKVLIFQQLSCNVAMTSFEYNNEERSETAGYTLMMDVTEGTTDYIFYQMEGHTGERTECFATRGFQLPEGQSVHHYGYMRNIGNPKKFYLLHDRNDDICIDYIEIHNDKTNDTIIHDELMCSDISFDANDNGKCNVITINFETGIATNEVPDHCPFTELCEFGLYEDPFASKRLHGGHIALIIILIITFIIILLSFIFGYKCIYCNSVYSILIHIWDPFVDRYWNPKCSERLCHCANTTDMQHNMCCYCCGCDYCNPFSIHRRRMEADSIAMERRRKKKNKGQKIDEYDTEDGDAFNLTTSHGNGDKYDMGSMDNIDLGDNIAGNGNTKKHRIKTRYSHPNNIDDDDDDDDYNDDDDDYNDDDDDDDIDDELGDIGGGYDDDSDSTELQLKGGGNKGNRYSSINDVEDAPINSTGMYDDNDDIPDSGVVDHYDDDPELR